jgi:exodeoxyribonuclease V beta subunit
MVKRVTSAPLPKTGFSLDQVAIDQRLNEWEFYLPLEHLKPAGLGDLFTDNAEAPISTEYADQLRRLDEKQVHGYLKGYVDLVFEHDGRWYIIDWKSNHLGNTAGEYDQDSLWRAMVDHHYVLQYHLYCAALHRFLKVRQDGYDYDKHFGGVFYAFVRGIDGTGDNGWYFDRPSEALVRKMVTGSFVPVTDFPRADS